MALDAPDAIHQIRGGQTYETRNRADSQSKRGQAVILTSESMRVALVVMASLLLGSPASVVAQPDLVNCEDFGFNAPMSCLDGVQPTAGPVPSEADMAEPTGPDGWDFDGDEGVTPGILVPF